MLIYSSNRFSSVFLFTYKKIGYWGEIQFIKLLIGVIQYCEYIENFISNRTTFEKNNCIIAIWIN
ncbi:MAG TPA: hypothetical protein DCW93_06350 [Saprospirales bacterium]|nr:hypothetical protein [Saprospirales bacterium]